MNWNDPNPIFFDIETQSAADLKECGGRAYAADPTTRILSLVARVDGRYIVWIPSYIKRPVEFGVEANLWPTQLGPAEPIELHHCERLPRPIREAANAGRTFVAHNAWGFDQFIWREKIATKGEPRHVAIAAARPRNHPVAVPPFLDTMPISRAAGLAGGLEGAAKALFGAEKDKGKLILKKYWRMLPSKSTPGEMYYPIPGGGDIASIARYNVADVALLARLWDMLDVEVEADVLAADCAINERGVKLDAALTRKIEAVAGVSVRRAATKIAELTKSDAYPDGRLNASNIGSAAKVKEWLGEMGLRILSYQLDADGNRKQSLRKDLVEQALANPWMMLDDDVPVECAKDISPIVFEVLRLRAASLRITSAKAHRAILRSGADGRARDLFQYWQAHTGRWSSAGIQVHNLPRAKKGVPIDELIEWHESGGWSCDSPAANEEAYDHIQTLVEGSRLSVDDALSSLLRPIFMADTGKVLLIADYNAIECRGVAWIAGEDALLDVFREGRDPYCEMACKLFHRPITPANDTERQIGKVVTLACSYGMGVEKFRVYCGLQGVDLDTAGLSAEVAIDTYRQAYPAIAGRYRGAISGRSYRAGGVWDQLGRAAMNAISEGGVHTAAKCSFAMKGGILICELPSGRKLRYHGARIEDRVPGYAKALGLEKTKATIVYNSNRGDALLYGGKITENVVQAICRDIFADAIVRCERAGLPVVMHGHDEIQVEVDSGDVASRIQEFADLMATPPAWATGFPLHVAAYGTPRNTKSGPKGWAKAVGRG